MTPNATTQTEALLLTETKDGVATLTLNRPGQFNALSSALIDELQTTFDRLAADPAVSVVVLAANGRGFCAGHDLKEIRAMGDVRDVESLFARCSRMMMTITTLPQPVIARVHGIATAAGCQLVATCDLAVAATAARFATPGVNIGAFCYTPGVALGRAVGRKHAMEMLLTGETISAERAYEIGLVNRVVSPEALDAEVETLARLHRVEVVGRHRVRQAGLLPSARAVARRRLWHRRTRHRVRFLHRRRQGRRGRVPRQARTTLDESTVANPRVGRCSRTPGLA